MNRVRLFYLAGAILLAMTAYTPASALAVDELITTLGTDPNVPAEYAQRRGYRGGYRGGRAVAYRGYGYRGGYRYGRRGVAVGGAAYPYYAEPYPYYGGPVYRGAYYRGGVAYRRGAYYRGGYRGARVAVYRQGGVGYRGGYRGGGRRFR